MDVIYINNNLHIIKTYKWVSKLGMLGYPKNMCEACGDGRTILQD